MLKVQPHERDGSGIELRCKTQNVQQAKFFCYKLNQFSPKAKRVTIRTVLVSGI